MTDLDQKVRELRALAGKAAPGPWGAWIKSRTIQVDARGGDGKLPAIINWPGFDGNDMGQKANNANAAYIAAANPFLHSSQVADTRHTGPRPMIGAVLICAGSSRACPAACLTPGD